MHSQKNVFVVLGVARSGTSAITRGLKALGIELSDKKMNLGHSKWNAKGFWEDTDIVYRIHGKIFSTLDFAPYGIQTLSKTEQTSEKLNSLKLAAMDLVNQRFSTTDYWAFKDPSTVKLLTFWQSVFNDLTIHENYIITLRNPLETAKSYQNLTGSSMEIGLLLWLMHILPAMDETLGKNRVLVSYDLLLQNPEFQLDRMQSLLKIPCLSTATERYAYTHDFIDKKLHRHTYQDHELATHPTLSIVPLCTRIYLLLMRLAKDEIDFYHSEFKTEWVEIKNEFEKIYPVYCYIDHLLKENNRLTKTLRDIDKSILWKMLFPFRKIDQTLRLRRQKKRSQNRLTKAYG